MLCPQCFRHVDSGNVCPVDGATLTERTAIDLLTEKLGAKVGELGGKVFGDRYVVRGYMGHGAMARVYLAEDLKRHTPVALKLLDFKMSRDRAAHDRFFREAAAASKISHPNIVHIFDSGRHADGTAYLVIEFLFGESLGDYLRRESSLSRERILAIFTPTALGLEAAHRAGIIHRDIKPDNVFLVGAIGSPYNVKVLDFGLAKLLTSKSLTTAGIAVGTVSYMAPEQVLTEPADARTDVYGLGVVLYRALTGNLPFDEKEDALILARHLLDAPTFSADVDPNLRAIAEKMLRKNPANRYASMADVAADFERVKAGGNAELDARSKLAIDPDVYEPRFEFGRSAAGFFYRKLGKDVPAWQPLPKPQ
jgi:serine/threonine protein kinase